MVHLKPLLSLAYSSLLLGSALATTSCSLTDQCPEDLPCCSQYGECGTGAYCLGGCDPRMSYNLTACMPMPVCKNVDTQFSTSSVISNTKYLGNASEYDWIYSGYVANYKGNLLVQMPNNTGGSVISSTHYVWYGKITAKLKTSHLKGVVTAFILFSDVKDEVDFENVGADTEKMQTNYYYQGILDYTINSYNITTTDTFENEHSFEVDWTEDQITWSVDGEVGRTLNKSDTWNSTTQQYHYPQTPSRVQISLWPGGLASNAEGTIAWAGGEINWDAEDITKYGYYYAVLDEVSIECYDAPSGTSTSGSSSYVFNNINANQSNVEITDDSTILGSFAATGFNPDYGKEDEDSSSSSDSGSSKSSSSKTTSAVNGVPTGSGSGNDVSRGDNSNDSDSDSSKSSSSSKSTSSSSSDDDDSGFQQSTGKANTTGSSNNGALVSTSIFVIASSFILNVLI